MFLTRVGGHWTLHVVTSPAAVLAATFSSCISSTPIHPSIVSVLDSMEGVRDMDPYPTQLDYMEKMLWLPQEPSAVDTCRLVVERTIIWTLSCPEQTNTCETSIFALATLDVLLATTGKKRKSF